MIEIDKGVEMPSKMKMYMKYPFAKMGVGDSFFVPDKGPSDLSGVVSTAKKEMGYKFTCRTIRTCSNCATMINFSMFCTTCEKIIPKEEVDTGLRVWRIE